MTENERTLFNETYKQHSLFTTEIVKAAEKITKPLTQELDKCVEQIISATINDKEVQMNFDELERLALRIPALCYYLQTKVSEFAIKNEVDELMVDAQVIEELNKIKGERGDAREKMKRAEATCTSDRIVEVLNKQICLNLRDTITRADKVYEGLKKILDARMRENEFNRKSQMFAT